MSLTLYRSIELSSDRMHIFYDYLKGSFSLQNFRLNSVQKIHEVSCAIRLNSLPRDRQIQFLAQTYPRLVQLSNGRYKLYICMRLLGGMPSRILLNRDVTPAHLNNLCNEIVHQNLGSTYTYVVAKRCHYIFVDGIEEEVIQFSLRPGSNVIAYTLLKISQRLDKIFNQVVVHEVTRKQNRPHDYDLIQMAEHALGITPSDLGQSDLSAAYNDRRTVKIYQSINDPNRLDCALEQIEELPFGVVINCGIYLSLAVAICGIAIIHLFGKKIRD